MTKTITIDELRKKIVGILDIVPSLTTVEVWQALLKDYDFSTVEALMNDIKEEKLQALRDIAPKITVSGGHTLEELIEDTERKKKARIKESF